MKRFLKISGILLGAAILALVIFLWIKHEPLPQGTAGPKADGLAQKMLTALNHDAYKSTRYLEWSYQGGRNQYVWDKDMGRVQVRWADHVVQLNLVNPQKSVAKTHEKVLSGEEKTDKIDTALKNFNNDSFWLVAPYKVFDKGTQRSIVTLDDGSVGLLVTYSSGGTTPGDSYLWLLNENGFPYAYKMWVEIIPVGGLKATWDDWIITESGAYLPKSHDLGPLTLDMGSVRGY
ncbi:hypothetical protein [Allomuricauda sp. d1]|uniref:hypothetical protein n=1 Tax=Allomuricauda sp. d1 TaxID=3136725 RepID=UPI0031E373A8